MTQTGAKHIFYFEKGGTIYPDVYLMGAWAYSRLMLHIFYSILVTPYKYKISNNLIGSKVYA